MKHSPHHCGLQHPLYAGYCIHSTCGDQWPSGKAALTHHTEARRGNTTWSTSHPVSQEWERELSWASDTAASSPGRRGGIQQGLLSHSPPALWSQSPKTLSGHLGAPLLPSWGSLGQVTRQGSASASPPIKWNCVSLWGSWHRLKQPCKGPVGVKQKKGLSQIAVNSLSQPSPPLKRRKRWGAGRARRPGVRLPTESVHPLWTYLDSLLLLLGSSPQLSVQADPTIVSLGLAARWASPRTPHQVPPCGCDSLGHTESHPVTLNVCRVHSISPLMPLG